MCVYTGFRCTNTSCPYFGGGAIKLLKGTIMEIRQKLKVLYRERGAISNEISDYTYRYLEELNDNKGIYITDHAIRRYLERVLNYSFSSDLSDIECIKEVRIPPEKLREDILSLEEDRIILNKRLGFYKKGDFGYIVRELSLITIIKI